MSQPGSSSTVGKGIMNQPGATYTVRKGIMSQFGASYTLGKGIMCRPGSSCTVGNGIMSQSSARYTVGKSIMNQLFTKTGGNAVYTHLQGVVTAGKFQTPGLWALDKRLPECVGPKRAGFHPCHSSPYHHA